LAHSALATAMPIEKIAGIKLKTRRIYRRFDDPKKNGAGAQKSFPVSFCAHNKIFARTNIMNNLANGAWKLRVETAKNGRGGEI
jgi:hypothetical protein